ncbi:MAG TPA: hypothetical protein VKX17_11860 [Planctomycetota bacterium]|nr:hypothetical protein [Planctomycetota bacterium]
MKSSVTGIDRKWRHLETDFKKKLERDEIVTPKVTGSSPVEPAILIPRNQTQPRETQGTFSNVVPSVVSGPNCNDAHEKE